MSSSSDLNKSKPTIHTLRTQVDDFGRKKYKLEEVAADNSDDSPQQHSKAIIDTGRNKSMLIQREDSLNIDKYIGKLENNKKKKINEVFYCDVCQEGFKYDMAYITHLNSPAHNRKIGMNMKVKAVTLDSVAAKIDSLKNKKQRKNQSESQGEEPEQSDSDSEGRYQTKKQEHNSGDVENQQVKEEQSEKEEQSVEDGPDEDQLAELEMMKQMGLPTSFGSSKKRKR